MQYLTEADIFCPYCNEQISILLDPQELDQEYVEDCQVCCRPMVLRIFEDSMGALSAAVSTDSDT